MRSRQSDLNHLDNLKASLVDHNERINSLADIIIAQLEDEPELLETITKEMIVRFDLQLKLDPLDNNRN